MENVKNSIKAGGAREFHSPSPSHRQGMPRHRDTIHSEFHSFAVLRILLYVGVSFSFLGLEDFVNVKLRNIYISAYLTHRNTMSSQITVYC